MPEAGTAPTHRQLKHCSPASEECMVSFFSDSIDLSHLEIAVRDAKGRVVGSLKYKGPGMLPLADFEWSQVVTKDELGELWKEGK
jgi:hypothetical protein